MFDGLVVWSHFFVLILWGLETIISVWLWNMMLLNVWHLISTIFRSKGVGWTADVRCAGDGQSDPGEGVDRGRPTEGGAVWDTKIWDCWIFVWLHLDFGKIIENHINGQQHGVDTFVGHHREVLKNFHGYCFSMGLGQPTIQALDSQEKNTSPIEIEWLFGGSQLHV